MQLTTIPTPVLSANLAVLGSLQRASGDTRAAQQAPAEALERLTRALGSAQEALTGVHALGPANMLDGTFQRYAGHAVRDLQRAVEMLGRGSLGADARSILAKHVFDAEVATRMGSRAGERSIETPKLRDIERATSFVSGDGDAGSGLTWVDGAWLDSLGNPVRGGSDGGYVGPDGAAFGPDGEPVRGGGDEFVGPDGDRLGDI